LALAQAIGRTDLTAGILSALAKLALRQGDPQRARAVIAPTVPVWEALNDRVGLGTAQLAVARAATMEGEYDEALAILDGAEAIFHDTGYRANDQFFALLRGDVAYDLGDIAAADRLYERAIELCTDAFEPIVMTLAL